VVSAVDTHGRTLGLLHRLSNTNIYTNFSDTDDRVCGLAVRDPGYIPKGPSSILGATGFSEK
jgi:hypothetical protein